MDAGAKGNKGRVRPTHALAVGALSLVVVFSLGSLMSGGRSSTATPYGSYGGAALAPVFTGAGHGDVGARLTAYEGKLADLMGQMAAVHQEVADVANTVANLEQALAEGGGRRYTPRPNPIALTHCSGPFQVAQPTPPEPPSAAAAAARWCGSVMQAGRARWSYGWMGTTQFRKRVASSPVLASLRIHVCRLGVQPTTRTSVHRSLHQPSTRPCSWAACAPHVRDVGQDLTTPDTASPCRCGLARSRGGLTTTLLPSLQCRLTHSHIKRNEPWWHLESDDSKPSAARSTARRHRL
jgi:hypothetical protein